MPSLSPISSKTQTQRPTTYRNAMESLVALEVQQQLQSIAPRIAKMFHKQEVIAFALNRLPTLYATSEKGWRQQLIKGRRDLSSQIATAVQQSLLAVQRDPLRCETPLPNLEQEESEAALEQLKVLLNCRTLTLKDLPNQVEQALLQVKPH